MFHQLYVIKMKYLIRENQGGFKLIKEPMNEFDEWMLESIYSNEELLTIYHRNEFWIVNTFLYNFYSVILAKRYSTGVI